jgi:adenosylmethionine-8-amino-7-oxononanoate aminotransferase
LPLAATLATEAVYESFLGAERGRMLFHGHTFTANAIACAAALASLDLIAAWATPARLAAIGEQIEAGLRSAGLPEGADLRRFGGIVAVELPSEAGGYLAPLGERLRTAAREHAPDVLLRPLGPVLYAMPPASTTPKECDLVAERMAEVLHAAGA